MTRDAKEWKPQCEEELRPMDADEYGLWLARKPAAGPYVVSDVLLKGGARQTATSSSSFEVSLPITAK